MLTAIVIDDELFAREELITLLSEIGEIDVIQQASNAITGLKMINQYKPDVVFLDIQMPQVTGIELIGMLDPETMPLVVFVTAFDQFAIQAFEDNAFDYLLKPIEPARLEKTVKRLVCLNKKSSLNSQTTNNVNTQHQPNSKHYTHEQVNSITPQFLEQVPCMGHNRIIIVPVREIESVFSDLSGVHLQTASQITNSQLTLKMLEEKTELIRCHRQHLISTKMIDEIKLLNNGLAEAITLSGHHVPISRRYLKVIKETLGIVG